MNFSIELPTDDEYYKEHLSKGLEDGIIKQLRFVVFSMIHEEECFIASIRGMINNLEDSGLIYYPLMPCWFFDYAGHWLSNLRCILDNDSGIDKEEDSFMLKNPASRDKINAVIDDMDKAESYRKKLDSVDTDKHPIKKLSLIASLAEDISLMFNRWRSELLHVIALEQNSRYWSTPYYLEDAKRYMCSV